MLCDLSQLLAFASRTSLYRQEQRSAYCMSRGPFVGMFHLYASLNTPSSNMVP